MWNDRRLAIFGGASLLLNVFLIGIVVGHLVATNRHPGPERRGGGPIRAIRLEALTPDERQRFTAAMSAHRPAIRAARDGNHAQRLATETDIAAPRFDRAKVAADFDALRKTTDTVSAAVDAGLVDALKDLSPDTRAALIARGRRRSHPRP